MKLITKAPAPEAAKTDPGDEESFDPHDYFRRSFEQTKAGFLGVCEAVRETIRRWHRTDSI
jgi:hypothetical protein